MRTIYFTYGPLFLVCVGLWFASERWTFARTKGRRWLLDILEFYLDKAAKATGIAPAKRAATHAATIGIKHARTFITKFRRALTNTTRRVTGSVMVAPRTVFDRMKPTLRVATDGLSTGDQEDAESQYENMQKDSPTAMSDTDTRGGDLKVHGNTGKQKLSDSGKDAEFTILEDKPPHLRTAAHTLVISPPSVGEGPGPSGLGLTDVVGTKPGKLDVPTNVRFKSVVNRVSTHFRSSVYAFMCAHIGRHNGPLP